MENHWFQTVAADCGYELEDHHYAVAGAEVCAWIEREILQNIKLITHSAQFINNKCMKLIRKSLDQLIKEKYDFFIPDYQRGYKWTRTEVLKLLNDIWDFKLNHSDDDDSDFYCHQPVVVHQNDGK